MKTEKIQSITGHSFFCSWSGGKDSCLALYHAIRQGGSPKYLFTMLAENGRTSRSHCLPKTILEQQALQLDIPIIFNSATWNQYERKFQQTLNEYISNRVEYSVFGDIDVESHREWCIKMCATNGIVAFHPLWQRSRKELIKEFINLGFKAIIVVTQADTLGPEWLGRIIDDVTINEFEKKGIDICGELGEYHTLVTDGPIFTSEIHVETKDTLLHDGHWYLIID
jgi:diphthine-ammonia ligase